MEVNNKIYLGLGSNLGDSKSILRQAILQLEKFLGIKVNTSKIYISDPLNPVSQPDMIQPEYFNMVCAFTSSITARELLAGIQLIENNLGLIRQEKGFWGPRLIDIDILSMGDLHMDDVDCKIPHPELSNRDFVLIPLNEIEPDYIHPISKLGIDRLIAELKARYVKASVPF